MINLGAIAIQGAVHQLWQGQQTGVGFLAIGIFRGPQTVGFGRFGHARLKLVGASIGTQLRVGFFSQIAWAKATTTAIGRISRA
jgi:hypothetical protein